MCVGLVGSRTSAELVVAPRNTVVVHGSPARLMCQTAVPDATSPPAAAVSWKFTSVDGDQQKFIYNDNGLNPKYERRGVSVVVDATAGSYALRFDAVRLDDAGTYTCQNDAASGDPRAAWLAVLGPHIQLISHARTHTHTHTTVLRPFVRDYPGEPVPEETFALSHPS